MLPIILAAGKSQRFIDAGYPRPKPFLNILYKGKECSMLEHVLDTIPTHFKNPIVGVPPGFSRFLEQEGKIHPRNAKLITIEKTRGQADTLLQLTELSFLFFTSQSSDNYIFYQSLFAFKLENEKRIRFKVSNRRRYATDIHWRSV